MDEKTLALLMELKDWADNPVAFAEMRQKVLQSHFESVDPAERSRLRALQAEIETNNAVEGTPVRALKALMDDLHYQCEALFHVQRQLGE